MTGRLLFLGFIISFQLLVCAAGFGATHTLTINTNGNGTVSRNPTNSVYPNGSVVTLTALPASGWLFSSWSGDANGTNNPLNVTMDADKVITANFSQIPNYTLAVNVSGNGSVNPPGGSFLSNTVVSLMATPSNGWVFGSWSGAASGNANPLNLTMDSNKSITATFVLPPSISSQPSGGSVNIGSSFSFSVTATGSAPLAYQWLFNRVALSNATAATLTLTNIQPGTGGNYQVVVSNPYGSATSAVAVLVVACPGTNVVSVASDAALRAAMAIGGNVRFCFSGTVTLTNTIDINKDVTLDAIGASVIINGGNAVRLFNVGTGVLFQATNVFLANGRYVEVAAGASAGGAAIKNNGGTVRLVSCTLSNHSVIGGGVSDAGGEGRGGAIYNVGGAVEIHNTLLVSNSAVGGMGRLTNGAARGGAIHSAGGSLAISNCDLVGNVAFNGLNYFPSVCAGGAVYVEQTAITIATANFCGNRAGAVSDILGIQSPASAFGGALFVQSGTIIMNRVQFLTNSVAGGSQRGPWPGEAQGGAIFNHGNMTVGTSTLAGNMAMAGGGDNPMSARGGAIYSSGSLAINATTIISNRAISGSGRSFSGGADGFGGGIFNSGTLLATNCTLAANTVVGGNPGGGGTAAGSAYGGGIFNVNGSTFMINTTVATNELMPGFYIISSGGFAFGANLANTNGVLSLKNTVVAYPRATRMSYQQPYPTTETNAWGTITDGGYNMCSDGSANFISGSSFNFTDPKLLPLANNGGPTLTMALAPDSPALDWAPALDAPATDQRGFHRPFGDGVDIGAFEAGPPVPALIGRRNGSALDLSFYGQAGFSYRIERSADFLTWELQEATGILAMNGVVLRTIPMTGSKLFFRLSLDF